MKARQIALLITAVFSMSAAIAGECPADKRVADGKGQKMVSHAAKGVTDAVRATCASSMCSPAASCRGTATTSARR